MTDQMKRTGKGDYEQLRLAADYLGSICGSPNEPRRRIRRLNKAQEQALHDAHMALDYVLHAWAYYQPGDIRHEQRGKVMRELHCP